MVLSSTLPAINLSVAFCLTYTFVLRSQFILNCTSASVSPDGKSKKKIFDPIQFFAFRSSVLFFFVYIN